MTFVKQFLFKRCVDITILELFVFVALFFSLILLVEFLDNKLKR